MNTIEVRSLYLRQPSPDQTELVVSHGGGVCIVYRLHLGQIDGLAINAPMMALRARGALSLDTGIELTGTRSQTSSGVDGT